ncbi:hypothetical protein [Escherichia coli]|uniref:hypothetical protein n=1 Tax=Escherichia coli TaxID=562 RepID=UPI003F84613C
MSFNAKDMTQGGQIASMRIRMFSQIANIMLYCLFIFFWILVPSAESHLNGFNTDQMLKQLGNLNPQQFMSGSQGGGNDGK